MDFCQDAFNAVCPDSAAGLVGSSWSKAKKTTPQTAWRQSSNVAPSVINHNEKDPKAKGKQDAAGCFDGHSGWDNQLLAVQASFRAFGHPLARETTEVGFYSLRGASRKMICLKAERPPTTCHSFMFQTLVFTSAPVQGYRFCQTCRPHIRAGFPACLVGKKRKRWC